MKKYDEYKDSGVAWIGEVPKHWKVSRIKFLISHSSAGVWGEDEKNDENDIVCFRAADFDYIHGCLRLDKMIIRNIQPEQLRGRRLHHGDLLIEKSGGGDSAPVGRIVRYNYNDKATCSNFVHFIRVNKFNDGNYLFYYFYAMYANNVNILFFNQTTGIQNLKIGEYIGQMIYTPILNEQTAIATYLDTHCAKIDNLISIQQKRIALLQELKQSIITHAVTKGLNPNVEMKQSGVEWIGDVPKHWEVRRLKYINLNSG
jgi:type I restriction modification DNA specificity domain protein